MTMYLHIVTQKECNKSDFVSYLCMTASNIKGTWVKTGTEYVSKNHGFSIVIGNRKHPKENKPNRYLLIKYSKSKFEYLSGLYPLKDNTSYHIDWADKNYQLTFTNDTTFKID